MSDPISKPVQAILIGAGQRGADAYGPYALHHPDQIRFVGVTEPIPERREKFARQHDIPPNNCFESWEQLLAGPRLGEAVLVCTQDREHTGPALAALQAGYHVLLEKPMAPTEAECRRIVAAAGESSGRLQVCHVLRYTPHFQKMREIVKSGVLGQVVNVSHRENVSWWHMAHSYVRGNWRNREGSAPMLLAKCCHDLDILIWILNRRAERLSSVGNLRHYRPENAPAGAPERCLDGCPAADSCPYYAPFIYIDLLPLWRSTADTSQGFTRLALEAQQRASGLVKALSGLIPSFHTLSDYRGWPRSVVTDDPSPENVMTALREGPYGRCVYHCDNDVVDHQVVSMAFEGGTSVTLTMHGHSHLEGRHTKIEGSRGELMAYFGLGGSWIEVNEHRSDRRTRYDTSAPPGTGHGGGDFGLMAAFVRSVRESDEAGALTTAQQALESHLMAFAADKARLGSLVVEMDAYRKGEAPYRNG
jgi:predicted dehydrogenase